MSSEYLLTMEMLRLKNDYSEEEIKLKKDTPASNPNPSAFPFLPPCKTCLHGHSLTDGRRTLGQLKPVSVPPSCWTTTEEEEKEEEEEEEKDSAKSSDEDSGVFAASSGYKKFDIKKLSSSPGANVFKPIFRSEDSSDDESESDLCSKRITHLYKEDDCNPDRDYDDYEAEHTYYAAKSSEVQEEVFAARSSEVKSDDGEIFDIFDLEV
jgi:hypothetical protein